METIIFQKHRGLLNKDDQTVMFYGVGFKNIIEAMETLKYIEFCSDINTYTGWYYNFNKGIMNLKTGEVFIDLRWLPTEKFAKEYIDTQKKNRT